MKNLPIKLMIISYWYPPDNRVPARRWGSLVNHLCALGVECSVVAAGDGTFDQYIGAHGERVIRLPISNRMIHSLRTKNKTITSIRGFWKPAVTYMLPPAIKESIRGQWFAYLAYRKLLLEIARDSNYIISSYGPLPPFFLGWLLSKNTGRPWIADIRDSFESRYDQASKWSVSFSRFLETKLLKQAKLRVTIGNYLAKHLSNTYKMDFSAIYNGWVDADVIAKSNKTNFECPYLYYAGTIYNHRIPALSIIAEALQQHPTIILKIRLLNDLTNGSLAQFMDNYKSLKIEILPPVDKETVDKELADALGALVLEDTVGDNVMRNGTVTGKLIGLLASGIPGIAVSSPHGEIRNLTANIPDWYGVDTVQQCMAALENLMKPRRINSIPKSLHDYHMSEQTERFLRYIKKLD